MQNTTETPRQYFQRRYGAGARLLEVEGIPRTDCHGIPNGMVAQSSQDFCDKLAGHVRSLLGPHEIEILGDYYFGLTREPLLSSWLVPVGTSYLIVVHRRMFNALEFLGDVLYCMTITDVQRWRILADYIRVVATAPPAPTELPHAPQHVLEEESVGAMLVKNGLFRFVLCHELGHVLPASMMPGVGALSELLAEQIRKPTWLEEFHSDLVGALVPLRETSLDGILADAYIRTTLASPILFTHFMDAVEQVKAHFGISPPQGTGDHPPGRVRAMTLEAILKIALPTSSQVIADVAHQTQRNFSMVLQQLHIGGCQR